MITANDIVDTFGASYVEEKDTIEIQGWVMYVVTKENNGNNVTFYGVEVETGDDTEIELPWDFPVNLIGKDYEKR